MNEIQRFITANCANYDRDGKCLLETSESGLRLCPMFYEIDQSCKYAEQSVLPGSPSLLVAYQARKGKELTSSFCEICCEPFERKSNRQKYCDSCSVEVRRKKKRSYNANYRTNKKYIQAGKQTV